MTHQHDQDVLVGENVQRFRASAKLSQAQLAAALERYGYAFQQQTILKIEKGTRPLKLAEALAIADVLGVRVTALTQHAQAANAEFIRARSYYFAACDRVKELDRALASSSAERDAAKSLMDALQNDHVGLIERVQQHG